MRQINLVTVTFDQTSEEIVTSTVVSVEEVKDGDKENVLQIDILLDTEALVVDDNYMSLKIVYC